LVTDEHSEVEVSDDAAMSIGDSDNEKEISDKYSGTGSSSCDESTTSHGSRKRPTDESPERETKDTGRREFPGAVTCSEGGCRICVPHTVTRDTTGAETPATTSPATTGERTVERPNAKAADTPTPSNVRASTAVNTDVSVVTRSECLNPMPAIINAMSAISNATTATPNATAAIINATTATTHAMSAIPNATVVIPDAMENPTATEVPPIATTENLDATERTIRFGITKEA